MRTLITVICLCLSMSLIYSCGQSTAQKQLSVLIAKQRQDSIVNINGQLVDLTAKLTSANDEMDKIKEFHIGRSENTREQQIEQQSIMIQAIQHDMDNCKKQLSKLQSE